MATEAQMRCSPATFSGRQAPVDTSRVFYGKQIKYLSVRHSDHRKLCSRSSVLLSVKQSRRRRSSCRAASTDPGSDLTEMPCTQQTRIEESAQSRRIISLPTVTVLGVIAALTAMMAIPAPADAAEALPLEFLSTFLVCTSDICSSLYIKLLHSAEVIC